MIFGLTEYMRERSPFRVRAFTAIHNLFLCLLSLGMYIAGAIATYEIIGKHRWTGLYYVPPKDCKGLFQWATYLFYLSKYYEFIDTAILALKKVCNGSHRNKSFSCTSITMQLFLYVFGLGSKFEFLWD
jgi:fatty acid elongase 3